MAGEIETFVRNIYVNGNILITDKSVYESYRRIYQIHVNNQIQEENQLDELTQELRKLYKKNIRMWEFNMEKIKIGQVFLRLMISIKKMSGSRMGEFGNEQGTYRGKNPGVLRDATGEGVIEWRDGNAEEVEIVDYH